MTSAFQFGSRKKRKSIWKNMHNKIDKYLIFFSWNKRGCGQLLMLPMCEAKHLTRTPSAAWVSPWTAAADIKILKPCRSHRIRVAFLTERSEGDQNPKNRIEQSVWSMSNFGFFGFGLKNCAQIIWNRSKTASCWLKPKTHGLNTEDHLVGQLWPCHFTLSRPKGLKGAMQMDDHAGSARYKLKPGTVGLETTCIIVGDVWCFDYHLQILLIKILPLGC